MNTKPLNRSTLATAVVVALSMNLAACGGGGGTKSSSSNSLYSPPVAVTLAPSSGVAYGLPALPTAPVVTPVTTGPIISSGQPQSFNLTENQATNVPATLTGAGIIVGLVDSGLDSSITALQGVKVNSVTNYSEQVDGLPASDYSDLADANGHGTLVAQVIAGQPWTSEGYNIPAGIAPGVALVVGKVSPDNGSNANEDSTAAIQAAISGLTSQGAKVLNLSIGGGGWVGSDAPSSPTYSTDIADGYSAWTSLYATAKSAIAGGAILVFAAGNDSKSNPEVSSALPTVFNDSSLNNGNGWLVVTAVDPTTGQLATYANGCGAAAAYCLAANGTIIAGSAQTGPNAEFLPNTAANTLVQSDGTSFSTPAVTAAAALVWQQFPWMTNAQVTQTILSSATPMGTGVGDATYGWGLLDVGAAVLGPGQFAWGTFAANVSAGNYTFGNNISGTGGLQKSGAGNLILSGNDTYTGSTAVTAGTLTVNGTLATSAVSVSGSGSTLTGNGIIGGNVTVSGSGTFLASGASSTNGNGGMAVLGNYSQDSSSTYAVQLGSPLRAGTASIAGKAEVMGVLSGYTPATTETILWTQNGLTGTFSSVTEASGVLLSATPVYTPYAVDLNISSLSLQSVASTASDNVHVLASASNVQAVLNQANSVALATGANVTTVSSTGQVTTGSSQAGTNAALTTAQAALLRSAGLVQLQPSAASVVATVRSLSGETYPTTTALEFTNLDAINTLYGDHLLGNLQNNSLGDGGHSAWAQAVNNGVSLSRAGYDSATSQTQGGAAGVDMALGGAWMAGIGIQGTDLNSRVAGNPGRDTVHDVGASIYAAWSDLGPDGSGLYADARLSGGHLNEEVQHTDILGTSTAAAGTRFSGQYEAFNAEAGDQFRLGGNSTLTPLAQLHVTNVGNNAFSETGVPGLNLNGESGSTTQTGASLGAREASTFNLGAATWTFNAHAIWTHLFNGANPSLTAFFDGAPTDSFSDTGTGLAANHWDLGAGLTAQLSKAWSFNVGYDRTSGIGEKGHTVSAGLQWDF